MAKRELLAWGLVITFGAALWFQFTAASKQEGRAELAEQQFKAALTELDAIKENSRKVEQEAAAKLEAERQNAAKLRALLRKGSGSAPVASGRAFVEEVALAPVPEAPSPREEAVYLCPQETDPSKWPCFLPFEPFTTPEGDQLKIAGFPVVLVGGIAAVRAEAAVQLVELSGEREYLLGRVQLLETELDATSKALAASELAMTEWRKAARKSRLLRFFSAVSKPALFILGVIVGRQL